ncbi:MAG: amino acid adenylation domain-containing protein [Anaerolineales bacterium]|nr:amino acid adenylation domain-containing protein [Anaerolineales bacterium]
MNRSRSDICRLFELQVEATPDAIAVSFDAQQVTYGELNRRANRLAHHLVELGIQPENIVGLCIDRSVEMLVGLLGILKAGAAYLPIDSTYPPGRIVEMVKEANVAVCLADRSNQEKLPDDRLKIVYLDENWPSIAECPDENPDRELNEDRLAYVIYTSGSTGKPKGVLIPHRAVLNHALAIVQKYRLVEGEAVLQFAKISFDVSVEEIFPTWISGGTVVLTSKVFSSFEEFSRFLEAKKITVVNLPTSYWFEWASFLARSRAQPPGCLRLVIIGSEKASRDQFQVWQEVLPDGLRWLNAYGLTETTITSLVYEPDGQAFERNIPIGRSIENVQAYILDRDLQPVEMGAPGELYIGGAGLARGYLNQPGRTAEKFIPSPFPHVPGERLFKTGDIARFLPDGNIEFIGRSDDQVKVRGFRIDPSEVEAEITQHPAVQSASVFAHEDKLGRSQLTAAIVLDKEQTIHPHELRHFLGERLPEFMIPTRYLFLDEFPLTPSGKIDRQALKKASDEPAGTYDIAARPLSRIEQELGEIWKDLFGLSRLDVQANFFELGGHSLIAAQMLTRVAELFPIDPDLRLLFEHPTLEKLAGYIETHQRDQPKAQLFKSIPENPDEKIPLSFSQERVWFLNKLDPGNTAYHTPTIVELRGKLDLRGLENAFTEIVRRHEIFRTTFHDADPSPVQQIHAPWKVEIPVISLEGVVPQEQAVRVESMIQEEITKPFDLAKLPLIRFLLIRMEADFHLLAIVEHHFVHDGWSFAVLMREFNALYNQFAGGADSTLPERTVQFKDFVRWQRKWMQSEEASKQLAYWKRQLTGTPSILQLPYDHPRPTKQSFVGGALNCTIPSPLADRLRDLSRQEGATLFMTMLAAFYTLLFSYTHQTDLWIGSGIANRRYRAFEQIIGMVINTVVFRANLTGDPKFRELLQRVRKVALEAYLNQDYPFDQVVEALNPARDVSYSPLFQVVFSFHDSPVPELDLRDLETSVKEDVHNGSAKFDLSVIVIPRLEQSWISEAKGKDVERSICMIWEYSTALFDPVTIERMMDHYRALLEGVLADPDRRLSKLTILSEAERHQILDEWNRTRADYLRDRCAHDLFEAQAGETPEATAVGFAGRQVTYHELNRRANQLAHYLQERGVGPETIVGICMERSIERVVGILGILKAGGAYLPIDPAQPKVRIAYLAKDSGLSILLTQESLSAKLPDGGVKLACLDQDWESIGRYSDHNPRAGVHPGNLAYVIYTSGSTGSPKGVSIEHRSLTNLIFWHRAAFAISARDRATHIAGFSFDAAVWEIWPYLTAGASVQIPSEEIVQSPRKIIGWMAAQGITISYLPTPLAEAALSLPWPEELSLRILLTGGDRLHLYPPAGLPFTVYNNYGPTENTVVTTCAEIQPGVSADRLPTIGRPIVNTQIYLLNDHFQPVPIGAAGELYIGGDGLARGYLHQPRLTAERFLPNPFSRQLGERLYRTGDLARYLPDGTIEFLGRTDQQVKIRGFRVELGEVEAALAEHPEVREAAVVVREDRPGDKYLAAYCIPQGERHPTANELRQFVAGKLPHYMVPLGFTVLEALPLTPNGKVDRKALLALGLGTLAREEEFVAPRTALEQKLAEIWAATLGVEVVSVEDNFFALGGHSLLAVSLIAQLQDVFQIEIPLRTIFDAPTIASMAAMIENFILEEVEVLSDEEAANLAKGIFKLDNEEWNHKDHEEHTESSKGL